MIIENLVAIGCDGTSVNTGFNGGVIRLIEEKLNKPLHWFICQLYANELPLRHVVQKFDGKTEVPRGFSGPIGKQLDQERPLGVLGGANAPPQENFCPPPRNPWGGGQKKFLLFYSQKIN